MPFWGGVVSAYNIESDIDHDLHQGKLTKIDENERKVTNIRKKYEKVGFDVKKERGKVHSV